MSAAALLSVEAEPVDPRFASVACVFFVIGAQKSGTTWFSRYLLDHPNVAVPHWKEHNYWNMVEGAPDPGRGLLAQKKRRETEGLHRKLANRLTFTKHARRQKSITLALKAADAPTAPCYAYADVLMETVNAKTRAVGEICPQYTSMRPETYARMAGLSPNVRFIMLMRDPVARFISGVQHHLRRLEGGPEVTSETLSESIRAFATDDTSDAITRSFYHTTIKNLERAVPPAQIAYGFFENLFNQEEVRRYCDFLGLPFVAGDVDRRRNDAGASRVDVLPQDRALIARKLRPVYDYIIDRFGDEVPEKWRKSAALSAAVPAGGVA